jgi:hypothetical protein
MDHQTMVEFLYGVAPAVLFALVLELVLKYLRRRKGRCA